MSQGSFEMTRDTSERSKLIDYLWAGHYTDRASEMLCENPQMAKLLLAKTANAS